MLVDRHQLDVGEAGLLEVGDQVVGQLAIVEEAVAVLGLALPRAEVDLIDRDRRVQALAPGPRIHPVVVVPGELGDVPDDRGGLGPDLGREAVGVGLLDEVAVDPALDLELVDLALDQAGEEDLPEAALSNSASGVGAAVPAVEVADHADPEGVGRPDGEVDPPDPLVGPDVGAELLVALVMRPLAEQMEVVIREDRAEPIRVFEVPRVAVVPLDLDSVGERARRGRTETASKKPSGWMRRSGTVVVESPFAGHDHPGLSGLGQKGADGAGGSGLATLRFRASPGSRTGPRSWRGPGGR